MLLARTADHLGESANAIRTSASSIEIRIVTIDPSNNAQRITAINDLLPASPVDVLINTAAPADPLGARTSISPSQLRQAFEINAITAVAPSRSTHHDQRNS